MAPWDIPGPPWPQGLDCKAWCEDHPGGYTGGDDNGLDNAPDVPDMDISTVNEESFTKDTDMHTGVDTGHEYKDTGGNDTAGQAHATKSGSSCTTGSHGLPWPGAVVLLGLLILALRLSRRRKGES